MNNFTYPLTLVVGTFAMCIGGYWILSGLLLAPDNMLQQSYQQLAYLGGVLIFLLGMLVNVFAVSVNGVYQELCLQRALAEKLG